MIKPTTGVQAYSSKGEGGKYDLFEQIGAIRINPKGTFDSLEKLEEAARRIWGEKVVLAREYSPWI